MNNGKHIFTSCVMKSCAMLCAALLMSVSAQAAFSLIHKTDGPFGVQENGMQATHTDYQIMYAIPGKTVKLYRPERSTFVGYVRWYCYDTDRAVPSWYTAEDSPTNAAVPRIESTWKKDTVAETLKFKARNEYGWFGYSLMGPIETGKATAGDANYVEIKYTMHKGDSIYRIACDQGIWNDYSPSTWNNDTEMTEPTLSKRTIYEIRPAAWMADSLELCKDMDGTNNRYLEEHKLIAPTGRQLYIGPDYMCLGSGVGTKITPGKYTYYALSSYFYISSQSNVTAADDKNKWLWYINGVYEKSGFSTNSAQFAAFSSNTPGTVTYTLRYNSADGVFFNVARFTVTYIDADEVGPSTNVPAPTNKMEMIYEEDFNYDTPNTTGFAFWNGYFDVDESTYGYYTQNISPTNRQTERNKITWSEYAVTNHKSVWVSSGTAPQVYQHVDGTANVEDNANYGYMLYCDGSQNPGLVFNLKVNADLCPGSTMYFSAWLCDASSSGSDKSAPNMDFVVTGIDDKGNEHALTTFTTGEFGINAGLVSMQRAKWYKIMFPVKFDAGDTYPSYRLRIRNKSTSSDGNDFAIDDIRIYVQKPPVMPIQASTSSCVDKAIDSIRAYLRVDYHEIDHEHEPLFYQWRDGDKIVRGTYFNEDSASTTFGMVNFLEDENITPADTCADLFSFDRQFRDTKEPVVRYILEQVDNVNERYVLYIAMPLEVRINHHYTGFVAQSPSQLGDRSGCGTFADMLMAGGTRITLNDEITFGDSVVTVCGHRDYTLNIVLTKIIQDETQGELRVDTTHCRADWLIGDSAYVDQHPEIYKYSFDDIHYGLELYRQHTLAGIRMVEFLKQHSLLTLDTAGITMSPGISLSYTAFPLEGSARDAVADTIIPVCTTPRFLHIQPAVPASNMMAVGTSAEADEGLPAEVKARPRVVRISDARRREGWFDVPLYRIGDAEESYVIDSIYTISSTEPNWHRVKLIADHDEMLVKDTIHLGNKIDHTDPVNAAIRSLKPGYDYTFHVAFVGESDEDKCDRGYTYFTLRVVPDAVTWLGGDWNLDASWDYAIPMDTTNVILQAQDYDITFATDPAESYDFNYTRNKCWDIYIPAGASMAGQENLQIRGTAYVDVPAVAQQWALTSVPVQGIVSGDLFVSQSESDDPFTVASINHSGTGTIAHDRYTYEVYDSPYDPTTNKWVRPDSILDRPIRPGDAVMIGIDCASAAQTPVIRLPKPDNMYHYYDANTHKWLADNVTITEDLRVNLGKPAWNGESTFTLTRAYNDVYLFGNPTFGYIDLTQLVADNSDLLTGNYSMAADGINALPSGSIAWTAINPEAEHVLLPPCRGVLLQGKSEADQLTINTSNARVTAPAPTPIPTPPPAPRRMVSNPSSPFQVYGTPIGRKGLLTPAEEHRISENADTIPEFFARWQNKVNNTIPSLTIYRTLYKDGCFNTICLPFDLPTLDGTDLQGGELFVFQRAEVERAGDGSIQLKHEISPVSSLQAGQPYLIRWPNTDEVITELHFQGKEILDEMGSTVGEEDGVLFIGHVAKRQITDDAQHSNLFIGANDRLYWPVQNDVTKMKGFRAYFHVTTGGSPLAVPYGTPARLVIRPNVATDNGEWGMVNGEGLMGNGKKVIQNGELRIIRGRHVYNAQGLLIE